MLKEIKSKRKFNSKLIQTDGKGLQRIYNTPIHYDNYLALGDGRKGYRSINKSWIENTNAYNIEFSPDRVIAPKYSNQKLIYIDDFLRKSNRIELTPLNISECIGEIKNIDTGQFSGESIYYENALGKGIDLIYLPTALGIIKIIKICSGRNKDNYTFKFKLEFDKSKKEILSNGNALYIRDKHSKLLTIINKPKVWSNDEILFGFKLHIYEENGDIILEKNLNLNSISKEIDIYTDLSFSYEAGLGNGSIRNRAVVGNYGNSLAWQSVREKTISDSDPNISGTDIILGVTNMQMSFFNPSTSQSDTPKLTKSYYPFDTSSLGNGQILSAKLNIYPYSVSSNTNFNTNLKGAALTKSTRFNKTDILEEDWKKTGGIFAIERLSNEVLYSSLLVNQYNSFNLNSVGLNSIEKNGISDFCIRDLRDIENSYNQDSAFDRVLIYSSYHSNPNLRPYLEIEYQENSSLINKINTISLSDINKISTINKDFLSKISNINL